MKQLIIVFFLSFIMRSGLAQQPVYTPNTDLEKFVGTWIYTGNKGSLTIVLQKKKININGTDLDVIEGYHLYTKSTESPVIPIKPTLTSGNTFSEDGIRTPTELNLLYYDVVKHKHGEVRMKMVDGKSDELKLFIVNMEAVRFHRPGEKGFDYAFSIPSGLILKKKL